eukprot:gene4758-5937_t
MNNTARSVIKATPEMVIYCFDSLVYHFDVKPIYTPKFSNDAFPLFVTWKIDKHGTGEPDLRGCIGTFAPKPLIEGLNKFSLNSAFQDSRFHPIQSKEIPKLHCSVSILVEFEDARDVWDWEVGVHGIWIHFEHGGVNRNATYLPEVAADQEWDKEETLVSLIKKAGHHGKIDQSFYNKIKLTRYQSSKLSLSYDEYKELKKQQQSVGSN